MHGLISEGIVMEYLLEARIQNYITSGTCRPFPNSSFSIPFNHHSINHHHQQQQLNSSINPLNTIKMQFKTLFTASLLSGLAVAAPSPKATCTSEAKTESSPVPKTFGLVALRSGSPIHFSSFSASQSGFDLLLPKDKQGAKCVGGKDQGTATFRLSKEGELFLYSTGKEQQIAYTDRSGMGKSLLF